MVRVKTNTVRKSTSDVQTMKTAKKNEQIDAEESSEDAEDIEKEENGVETKKIQKNGHHENGLNLSKTNETVNTPKSQGRPKKNVTEDVENDIEDDENDGHVNGNGKSSPQKNGLENGIETKPVLPTNGSVNTPKSRGRPKKVATEDAENGMEDGENDDENDGAVNDDGKSSIQENGHENETETKPVLPTNGAVNTQKSRGRPKKVTQDSDNADLVVNGKSDATPKTRGRPKKVIKEDDQNEVNAENEAEIMDIENSDAKTSSSENATESTNAPKPRGRPKKAPKTEDDDEQDLNPTITPRSRGRPRKVVTAENGTNGHDNVPENKPDSTSPKAKLRPKNASNVMVDLDDESDSEEDEENEENESEENETNGHDNETPTKSGLLSECKKLFGTNDLYSVLNLKKTCEAAEIKKAYYKFSLKYHPDKTEEAKKHEHKVKFQLLCQVYSILSDVEKRKIYDETGCIDGENELFTSDKDWSDYWRTMFKKITKEDIDKFFEEYRNSDEERADLLTLYEKHKGDFDLLSQEFFSQDLLEDEPRMRKIITDAIENGNATAYDMFTNESKRKAGKRKAMLESEAKEAEQMRKKMGMDDSEESLKALIHSRQKQRDSDFLTHLTEKYVNQKQTKKPTKSAKRTSESDEESDDDDDQKASSDDDEDYDPASKRKKIPRATPGGKKNKKIKRL